MIMKDSSTLTSIPLRFLPILPHVFTLPLLFSGIWDPARANLPSPRGHATTPYGPLAMLLLAAPVLPVPAISFLAHFCWFQRCAATIHAKPSLLPTLAACRGAGASGSRAAA
jgi:hypothetical protein